MLLSFVHVPEYLCMNGHPPFLSDTRSTELRLNIFTR